MQVERPAAVSTGTIAIYLAKNSHTLTSESIYCQPSPRHVNACRSRIKLTLLAELRKRRIQITLACTLLISTQIWKIAVLDVPQ